MKSKLFRSYIWGLLIVFSVFCYGYLLTQDISSYAVEDQSTASVSENEEEANVSLPDIALLKKVYELVERVLNR